MSFRLECIKCKQQFPFNVSLKTCPEHNQRYGYLQIVYDKNIVKPLPINKVNVDLGHRTTPLIKLKEFAKKYKIKNIYIKDEGENPTGSFKDRENFIFFSFEL